jgi:hypothetical protein
MVVPLRELAALSVPLLVPLLEALLEDAEEQAESASKAIRNVAVNADLLWRSRNRELRSTSTPPCVKAT